MGFFSGLIASIFLIGKTVSRSAGYSMLNDVLVDQKKRMHFNGAGDFEARNNEYIRLTKLINEETERQRKLGAIAPGYAAEKIVLRPLFDADPRLKDFTLSVKTYCEFVRAPGDQLCSSNIIRLSRGRDIYYDAKLVRYYMRDTPEDEKAYQEMLAWYKEHDEKINGTSDILFRTLY